MKRLFAALAGLAFAALTTGPVWAAAAPVAPAGTYTLDKAHASLTFRVNHLGFSLYTARFSQFDATLKIDPAKPAAARIDATIDPKSLDLDNPPAGFTEQLLGDQWLDAAKYPQMSFHTTSVKVTGAKTAKVTGDFTLHGVTKPVTLDVRFNGGYAGFEMDPHARIGFSATGKLKRSDFGISYGIPAPGTTMGVGDEVNFDIEAEFSGPAWTGAAKAQ